MDLTKELVNSEKRENKLQQELERLNKELKKEKEEKDNK